MVPNGWTTQALGDVLEVSTGGAWGSSDLPNGTPVLRTNNIRPGVLLDLSIFAERAVPPAVVDRLRMRTGDVLMTKSNSIERIGECGLFEQPHDDDRGFIPSNFCQLLRFNPGVMDPWFGLLWLRLGNTQARIKEAAAGTSSSLKNVSARKLRELQISYPSLAEQRRIVAKARQCLSRLEEIEGLQQRWLAEAKALIPAFMSEVENSMNWPLVSVETVILESQNGRSIRSEGDDGNGRVLTLSAVRDVVLNLAVAKTVPLNVNIAAAFAIRSGDVFVSRSNTIDLVGLASVALEDGPPQTIYPDLLIRLKPDRSKIQPLFLAHALRFPSVRRQIRMRAKGTSQSMVKISGAELRDVQVPVPGMAEQDHFIAQIEELRNAARLMTDELGLHRPPVMADAILRKAFAGEL